MFASSTLCPCLVVSLLQASVFLYLGVCVCHLCMVPLSGCLSVGGGQTNV